MGAGVRGRWEKNDFTTQFGGPRFRPKSVTSYVTPWNGFNVAGIIDDGRVVVCWWVPSFQGAWNVDEIEIDDDGGRRLSSHVAPDGSFHLTGVSRGGEVNDLHWDADRGWRVERMSDDDGAGRSRTERAAHRPIEPLTTAGVRGRGRRGGRGRRRAAAGAAAGCSGNGAKTRTRPEGRVWGPRPPRKWA